MRAFVVAALCALSVAGCAGVQPTANVFGAQGNAVAAREFAGPSTYVGQMPVGIILLKRSSAGDHQNEVAFCQAYLKRVPTVGQVLNRSVTAPNIIVTRWLLDNDSPTLAQAQDCNYLVDHYDYRRAADIMINVQLSQGSFSGAGPYLAVVSGSNFTAIDGSQTHDYDAFVSGWDQALNKAQSDIATTTLSSSSSSGPVWAKLARVVIDALGLFFPVVPKVVGVLKTVVC